MRISTERKRQELELKQKEREELKFKKNNSINKKQNNEFRRLTQEELLEEAKITEKINLASLG